MIDDPTDVGDGGEIEVGGGAPAGGAAAAPGGGEGGDGKGAEKRMTFRDAMAVVRDGIKATKGEADPARAAIDGAGGAADGGDGGDGGEQESAEALEERLAAMTPEDRAAEETRLSELAASDPLIIDLGARREGEEPIRIQAADQQMADQIRALQNRAVAYDESIRIRDEAEAYRAQADEMSYGVQLDPAGFLLENLKSSENFTADAMHVARVLLTQPGVLENMKDWVVALAAHPEAIPQEARLANADRVERKTKTEPLVKQRQFENKNARDLVREAYRVVQANVPDWAPPAYDSFVRDIVRDLQDVQQQENVRVTDPRRVKGLVERRLKAFGVAPGAVRVGAGGGGNGRLTGKPGKPTGPSGQQLVATDTARRRAAGPGPGAGSPAAGIPKPPAGTKLTGKNNVFDFIRERLPALRRAPR